MGEYKKVCLMYRHPDYAIDGIRSALGLAVENMYAYETLLAAYPQGSIKLLKAIAKAGSVKEVNSSGFIAANRLKAASSVNVSLRKLLDKELIYKSIDGYMVYDRFMAIWLKQLPY